MAISSLSKKIVGFLLISIFLLSVNVEVSNVSFITQSLLAKDDTPNEEEKIITPDEETDFPDNLFSGDNFTGHDYIMGEALRVTPNQLLEGEYYSAIDSSGILHTVWIQKLSLNGYSICYTHSNDSLGQEWTDYEIMFRTLYRIYNIKLVVDKNGNLHIFFTVKFDKFRRLYYLLRDPTNITNDFEVLSESNIYEFYDISTFIIENNTMHVSWITMFDDKKNDVWYSYLTYYSKNLTSYAWIGDQTILLNESNPFHASMSGNDEAIDILWSKSDNYTNIQDLMITTYNFTTSLWNTSFLLTENNKFNSLRCQTSENSGVHIMYVKYGNYFSLNYGRYLRNGSLIDFSQVINNPDLNCFDYTLLEEPSGNLTLFFEDHYGMNEDIYFRKKDFGNSTWSTIMQLTATEDTTDIFLLMNPEAEIFATLFVLVEGSIHTAQYYYNDTIGGVVCLYYATQTTYNPTTAVDSNGVAHMICYHEGSLGIGGLLYQKLYPNSSRWTDFQIITPYLYHSTSPKLVIDSNDTLHLYYSQYDVNTSFTGLFYMSKNSTSDSWSYPKIIHEPNGDVITHYAPLILFDENESIHIIWRQFSPVYVEIYYTYKRWDTENFTVPELLQNYRNDTSPYQINALIDRDGTIHLTNSEYSDVLVITMIIYRSKPLGGNWMDPLVLEASYDLLYKPMLVEDLDGDIQLYCTESVSISYWRDLYESDIHFWELPYGSDEWAFQGLVVEKCATAYYFAVEQAPDGTLFIVYINADYSIFYWRDVDVENITVIFKPVGGEWSEEMVLFYTQHVKTIPKPFYNPVTDQFINLHQYSSILFWYSMQNDTDQDGVGDMDELVFLTDPNNPDTDADGLTDGLEIEVYGTNPIIADTDWDGLLDGQEVYFVNASDPTLRDTDRDGLPDGDEVLLYQSDPSHSDSDQDGLFDANEVLILGSSPIMRDTDSDGMDDLYEYLNGLNLLVDDSLEDPDDDMLTNIGEYIAGTDVYNNDTDGDFIIDGLEYHTYFTNPLHKDTDEDTLTDWEELFEYFTNPLMVDSDQDGFTDREEINAGTDPNDPRDNIRLNQLRKVLLGTIIPVSVIIIVVIVIEFLYQKKKKTLISNDADEIVREEATLENMMKEKEAKKGKPE